MVKSYDVGSMPFEGEYQRFLKEAENGLGQYFREKVVQGFVDKVFSGLDVVNYPQYRDMNEMMLNMVNGIAKVEDGFLIVKQPTPKPEKTLIPEVEALKTNLKRIYEQTGSPAKIKICITGPHTLSWMFTHRDNEIFLQLSEALTKIVEENIFKEKYGEVFLLSIDEPLFGVVDDQRLDYGSTGRENLAKAWEKIFYPARSKNIQTILHLHNTKNGLYWTVENLKIIESHVRDPFYSSKQAKKMVEQTDKFVKASIAITDFDDLIKQEVEANQNKTSTSTLQEVASVWTNIRKGWISPEVFLEDVETMRNRLRKVVELFGVERVPYAGAECGLKSFPTYKCAVEYLKSISKATKNFAKD